MLTTRIVMLIMEIIPIEAYRKMAIFVGRQKEITKLNDLAQKRQASLVVIKGRRRIGKSRLAAEYAKNKTFLNFTGLAPVPGVTAQNQRDTFAIRLAQLLKLPPMAFHEWEDALNALSFYLKNEPTVILFDEISWMGSKDAAFVSKLKTWWDSDIQNRSNITLIFCGSVSTWIEEHILKSTAFFGRISLTIELAPLSLAESTCLLKLRGIKGSEYDFYKLLAVTGGIPWYLEQILPHYSADQNIHKLCFEKDGLLVVEFDRIFHDLFSKRGEVYKNILLSLQDGMKTLDHIRQNIDYGKSGTLSGLVEHLITAGFVTKHTQWSIKTGANKRQSLYRLNDPYIRFFLKYIEPNLAKIHKNFYEEVDMAQLPGYETMLGFQIECLLLQNRSALLRNIGMSPSDCVFDNPYIQIQSTKNRGCQIDYLIQTRTNNIYVCEFKFRRKELEASIMEEVQNKIDRLSLPRGYAAVPVLFQIGGVADKIIDQRFFYRIVDMAFLLKE